MSLYALELMSLLIKLAWDASYRLVYSY